MRSLRVVPYTGATPGSPLPYQESYSTVLDNADAPQIGWSGSGVYWTVNDGSAQADSSRFSQGSGSLKAVVNNLPGGYGYPGVELHLASGLTDWRAYESFIYDVWPAVNASAVDQAPDLYYFKLYNTTGCPQSSVTQGGPPQAMREGQAVYFSITKLTSLKSLCKERETAHQFVFFLAHRTQAKMEAAPRSEYISEANWILYQNLGAEAVIAMSDYLENPTSEKLQGIRTGRNKVRDAQNEYRRVGRDTVRIIHSQELLLIEYALECMLSPELAPDYAYRVGRISTERYDPHYGTGLIPASIPLLEDLVQFWFHYYDL